MPSLQSLIITREDVGLHSRQEVLPSRTESRGSAAGFGLPKFSHQCVKQERADTVKLASVCPYFLSVLDAL